MLLNGAANRDPREFEHPDELRLDRVERSPAPRVRVRHPHLRRARRSPAPKRASRFERILDRMGDIRISEAAHGPAGDRRYDYTPIYMLRGLEQLAGRVHAAGRAGRTA